MHELGIVVHVLNKVKKTALENNVSKVNSVTLEIGEVSGVVFDYLKSAWDWSVKKEEGALKDSILKCEIIKAETVCEDCKKTYETVKYGKTCPHCKSERTFLVSGDELNIKNIEVI